MAKLDEIVGQRVRAARKARGLTQENVAEAAGIAHETLSRLERGTQSPRLPQLLAVAHALQTTVGALVDGSEPPAQRQLAPEVSRLAHILEGQSETTQKRARQMIELALSLTDD